MPTHRKGESDSHYARRAFKMNEKYFEAQKEHMNDDRTVGTPTDSYRFFKEETMMRQGKFHLSLEDAIKNTVRSNYISYAEMARMNLLEGMKKDKELWKQFREAIKVGGKYQKFDLDNIEFDPGTGAYTYKTNRKLKSSEVGVYDPMDELYGIDQGDEVGEVEVSLEFDYHNSSGIRMSTMGVLK